MPNYTDEEWAALFRQGVVLRFAFDYGRDDILIVSWMPGIPRQIELPRYALGTVFVKTSDRYRIEGRDGEFKPWIYRVFLS